MSPLIKLIAIVLPEPVLTQIRSEQEYIAGTWGPSHALRTPPHITIIPPIAVKPEEAVLLNVMATAIAQTFQSFRLTLLNYGAFKPRVIFVPPEKSEALDGLQATWQHAMHQKLPHTLANYPDRPYHPHITLAHKDVRREQFEAMWAYYSSRDFHATVEVREFCILNHTPSGWEVEHRFLLQ